MAKRTFGALLAGVLVLLGGAMRPDAHATAPARGHYSLPVTGATVVTGFDDVTPYAAGHRGVDLAVTPGIGVLAPADGIVSFAGQVAGRGLVVIAHPDGLRSTLEPVEPSVSSGAVVTSGEVVGVVAELAHGDCAPGGCLHWGVRRAELYVNPLLLLRPLGPVRLIPIPR